MEDITILKDATAASIWGVRAGNGVIVITTKKAKRNQPPAISFNSNMTLIQKPDMKNKANCFSMLFYNHMNYLNQQNNSEGAF